MGWFGRRGASDEPTLEQLRTWHLLLVPADVSAERVERLIRSRHPDADLVEQRRARLGRRSAISGPHLLEADELEHVKVPEPWRVAYALEVAREPDPAAFDDIAGAELRAWWMRAFPQGKPYRDEGDTIDLALGIARRLNGAVRAAGSNVLLQPDHDRLSDLTVWSGYWIDPAHLLGLVSAVLPGAVVDLAVGGHHQVPRGDDTPWSVDPLDPHQVDLAHALGDVDRALIDRIGQENDARALRGDIVLDGFEVMADGDLSVEVIQEEAVPTWVRDRVKHQLLSADNPVVTYTVRWRPEDLVAAESEDPSYAFRVDRDRVRPRLHAAAVALAEATAGVISDTMGFEVDRYTL